MKKTISLATATRLKEELDRGINDDNLEIKRLLKEKNKEDADKIQKLKDEKSALLLCLTDNIAALNVKKGRGESHTNTYYIKYRSELTREKRLLEDINADTKTIKDLMLEINVLEAKLTKFNLSHDVKIEINQNLLDTITTFLEEK